MKETLIVGSERTHRIIVTRICNEIEINFFMLFMLQVANDLYYCLITNSLCDNQMVEVQ